MQWRTFLRLLFGCDNFVHRQLCDTYCICIYLCVLNNKCSHHITHTPKWLAWVWAEVALEDSRRRKLELEGNSPLRLVESDHRGQNSGVTTCRLASKTAAPMLSEGINFLQGVTKIMHFLSSYSLLLLKPLFIEMSYGIFLRK